MFFEAKIKNKSSKLSAKFSFTPILKISWKNIEKRKSLLSGDNLKNIANGDMVNFEGIIASFIFCPIRAKIGPNMGVAAPWAVGVHRPPQRFRHGS